MTRENLELARSAIGDLGTLFDLFDENIIWQTRVGAFEAGVYRGKNAVIDLITRYVGTWSDYRFEVEAMLEAGDSIVLTVHETARGRGSGVPMEYRYCQVWTFQDGRIVRGGAYHTKTEALDALALSG